MEFSRAVLAACVGVLGFIFYAIAALLVLLTIANALRGDGQGAPVVTTLTLAAGALFVGFACRLIARRLA